MKKFICSILLIMSLSCSAFGAEYPEIGVCVGDNVRLREDPGTDGKIIGRADPGTQFVILSEMYSDGQKWYEIDNPTKEGNAFIIARYVNYGWYRGNDGAINTGKDFAEVRITFGITPEKTRLLLGSDPKVHDETLEYPGINLSYDEGYLSAVELTKKGYAIAGIEVGDPITKLVGMGMPESYIRDLEEARNAKDDDEPVDGPEGWTYESASGESIFFQFGGNSKGEFIVDMITWSRPLGEG